MPEPITIDIPHKAGRLAARQRLESGLGQLSSLVPGGSITEHHWEGDTLRFTLEALGQRIASLIEVHEDRIHAVVDLPPTLALFAATIRAKLGESATKMLR